jgi:para-aminobenzoate synthetase
MRNTYSLFSQKLPFYVNPEDVFTNLYSKKKNAWWLDSNKIKNGSSEFSYMGDISGPLAKKISYTLSNNELIITSGKTEEVYKEDIFSYLGKELITSVNNNDGLPGDFHGGFVGYLGYELKALCGSTYIYKSSYPDSLWYFADRFFVFDYKKEVVYAAVLVKDEKRPDTWFKIITEKLSTISTNKLVVKTRTFSKKRIQFHLSRNKKRYLKDISICKNFLRKGESYQLCLTNSVEIDMRANTFSLYKELRRYNPAPYGAYIKDNNFAILCSSPEKFLTITKDRQVISKPMKGTMKRGINIHEDKLLVKNLRNSKKEQAENLMIVDLIRNDLGKVCNIGSIVVSKLMGIESYKTVHQMVSTITGVLRDDVSVIDCIKSCFPGGSMTGAPKLRTMTILDQLEKKARGIYSGTLGFLSLSGAVNLNMIIRTIIAEKNKLSIGIGGAILIGSNPEKEYEETILKAKALMQVITNERQHTEYTIRNN